MDFVDGERRGVSLCMSAIIIFFFKFHSRPTVCVLFYAFRLPPKKT